MAEELLKHQPISGATHKHTGSPRDDSTASYVGDDNYDEIQEAGASQDTPEGRETLDSMKTAAKEQIATTRGIDISDVKEADVAGVHRDREGN